MTGAIELAPERLPDLKGPRELEQALLEYSECVEESFPIVIRFRTDAFTGLYSEVASQRAEDDEQVERVTAECSAQLDLDRRLSAYQSEFPISPEARRQLVDEFISCAGNVSTDLGERAAKGSLASESDVMRFVFELTAGDFTSEELIGISDCQSDMSGPAYVFADGHPWFTEP